MIQYPADFPAAARAAVERALADAEDEFIAASAGAGPVRTPMLPGVVTFTTMWDKSDRATVDYVLEVFQTIIKVSCAAARKGQWPAEQLRVTTTDLLAQLTEQAYRHKHSKRHGGIEPMTLDDFTTIIHRELRTFGFWSDLQKTIRQLSAAPVEMASRQSAHNDTQLKQRAAWLRKELDGRPMTLSALEKEAGPDRKTANKILNAKPVTEPVLKRLAVALKVNRKDIP